MKEDVIKKTIENYKNISENYCKEKCSNIEETKEILDLLINYLNGNKVIDIGCGPGRDAKYLSLMGLEVVGIDLTEEFIEFARTNAPKATFLKMDMRKMNFENKNFDGIYCRATLLHIPKNETKNTLLEFKRILKNNGILYIGVKKGIGEKFVKMNENDIRFYSFYSEEEIKNIIELCGFKIIKLYNQITKTDEWINVFCEKL